MNEFDFSDLFNMEGRKNLGGEMPVLIYRLFEYSLRSYLTQTYGKEECIKILRGAGRVAGEQLCEHVLDTSLPFSSFVIQLQNVLEEYKMGILRLEHHDETNGNMTLTVSEDLDCSGLPVIGDTVCNYDEGLIAGILSTYTKENYETLEVDCWAKGDRVCRFQANKTGQE